MLCGGMESMSRAGHVQKLRKPLKKKFGPIKLNKIDSDIALQDTMLIDGLMCSLTNQHMGNTAENIAAKYNISRLEQDSFARRSHEKVSFRISIQNNSFVPKTIVKALEAINAGRFANEIIPVCLEGSVVSADECPVDISENEYASYPCVFQKGGTVTKGNACGLNDGASTILVCDKSEALKLGLDIEAQVLGTAMVGCDPNIMGVGPVGAVKKLMEKIDLNLEDIDLFELNEAFSAQSLACIKELDIPIEKVVINFSYG